MVTWHYVSVFFIASSCDWDQVTQDLVKLGFKLIDSFGPKPVFGVLPDNDLKQDSLSPSQQACQLGQRLLLKTFKASIFIQLKFSEDRPLKKKNYNLGIKV